jgi:hypothetical protein
MTKKEKQEFLTEIFETIKESRYVERYWPMTHDDGIISLYGISVALKEKYGWEVPKNDGH